MTGCDSHPDKEESVKSPPSAATIVSSDEMTRAVDEFVSHMDPLLVQLDDVLKQNGFGNSTTVSNFLALAKARMATEQRIVALKADINALEFQLDRKTQSLTALKSSIDEQKQNLALMKLSPQQLALIQRYNQSINHDPKFSEWVRAHQTWFDVGKDIVVGIVLLWIGTRIEPRRF